MFSISSCLLLEDCTFLRICLFLLGCRALANLSLGVLGMTEVKSLSRFRLCDPVDCSPPGSSVHGILQARILEWVAVSFWK